MKRHYLILLFFLVPLAAQALEAPQVVVSSDKLLQADTLLVVVKNEPDEVSGTFGGIKLRFFRNESGSDWVAITGAAVKKLPGKYVLRVNAPGKTQFKKTITVLKRKFPIASFVITPDLAKEGFSHTNVIENLKKEKITLAAVLNSITPDSYAKKPFGYPLAEMVVTGRYGDIRKSGKYSVQHLGVDLKASVGTPVLAINDGKVVFTAMLPDYGNTIILDHVLVMYSLYLHLSEFKAEKEQMVRQGDTIGLAGATGYSIGPHLHLSINVRGASLDPLKFIEATRTGNLW